MADAQCELGMIGLGVMGRNLVLNMADHGFRVAGYDKDPERVRALAEAGSARAGPDAKGEIHPACSPEELAGLLRVPRAVMILVPAGEIVDAVLRDICPHLSPGDVVIDGGNSHCRDTDARAEVLAAKGLRYLGLGVSGGEEGARRGPSLMPGGPREAYERVRPILEAVAAKAAGELCVAHLGEGSAGHYVKMVHNGIEYGLMQLIAETYDLMKRGLGFSDQRLRGVYRQWSAGEAAGFLMDITADIFERVDPVTGKLLVEVILDEAGQKGTGAWTSHSALTLGVPTPIIDSAVMMRNLSVYKLQRLREAGLIPGPEPAGAPAADELLGQLERAMYAGMLLTYAQGFALLSKASEAHGYGLHLAEVARIWRGGCIIRSAMLDDILAAFQAEPNQESLLADRPLARRLADRQADLRAVVCAAARLGLPAPGFMSALAYLDAFRSGWLPANLIQAQRDYFGAHTYERVDEAGSFHTAWKADPAPKGLSLANLQPRGPA